MLKNFIASFAGNEDGHADNEITVMLVNGVAVSAVAVRIVRLFMKAPGIYLVPVCIAAVCVFAAGAVWFHGTPDAADVEFGTLTVLSFAALAGYAVFWLAGRIWKIREAGIVPGCIAAACIAVPGFRQLLREIREDRMRDGNEEEPDGGETDSTEHGGRP